MLRRRSAFCSSRPATAAMPRSIFSQLEQRRCMRDLHDCVGRVSALALVC